MDFTIFVLLHMFLISLILEWEWKKKIGSQQTKLKSF